MRTITRPVSAALLGLASSSALTTVGTQPIEASTLPVPAFDHIFTILMENHPVAHRSPRPAGDKLSRHANEQETYNTRGRENKR